jgi:hypothetical protein
MLSRMTGPLTDLNKSQRWQRHSSCAVYDGLLHVISVEDECDSQKEEYLQTRWRRGLLLMLECNRVIAAAVRLGRCADEAFAVPDS